MPTWHHKGKVHITRLRATKKLQSTSFRRWQFATLCRLMPDNDAAISSSRQGRIIAGRGQTKPSESAATASYSFTGRLRSTERSQFLSTRSMKACRRCLASQRH
jgi:hypothetical protein